MDVIKMFWKMCEDMTVDELIKWKARSAVYIQEQGIDESKLIPTFNEIIDLHIRAIRQGIEAAKLYTLEQQGRNVG